MLWKLLGGGIALALAGFLIIQFGNARYHAGELEERTVWQALSIQREQQHGEDRLVDEQRVTAAVSGYADRLAAMEPVILHSTNTVKEYAQTAAGAAPCLGADRVRGIEQNATLLGLQVAPDAGVIAPAVRPNTDPARP